MTHRRHLDACPECMARDNIPTRTETVPDGVQCHYECACGSTWMTSYWEVAD